MLMSDYQSAALKTAKNYNTLQANLIHAALGIATEGGEFTTEVKRLAIYEKEKTTEMYEHMVEELGDLMWYIALACQHLEIDMGTVAMRNIAKLTKRYPNLYSNTAAEGRADKGGQDARNS